MSESAPDNPAPENPPEEAPPEETPPEATPPEATPPEATPMEPTPTEPTPTEEQAPNQNPVEEKPPQEKPPEEKPEKPLTPEQKKAKELKAICEMYGGPEEPIPPPKKSSDELPKKPRPPPGSIKLCKPGEKTEDMQYPCIETCIPLEQYCTDCKPLNGITFITDMKDGMYVALLQDKDAGNEEIESIGPLDDPTESKCEFLERDDNGHVIKWQEAVNRWNCRQLVTRQREDIRKEPEDLDVDVLDFSAIKDHLFDQIDYTIRFVKDDIKRLTGKPEPRCNTDVTDCDAAQANADEPQASTSRKSTTAAPRRATDCPKKTCVNTLSNLNECDSFVRCLKKRTCKHTIQVIGNPFCDPHGKYDELYKFLK